MKTIIKLLKASHGDSILIKTFDNTETEFNILIDGGTVETYASSLKKELEQINSLDLLVLTHIDSDHIGGINKFVKSNLFDKIDIKKYWINCANLIRISSGGKISFNQGKTLEETLLNKKIPSEKWDEKVVFENCYDINGLEFKILSPTDEILKTLFKKWEEIAKLEYSSNLSKRNISDDTISLKTSLVDLAKEKFVATSSIENDIFNSSSIAFILKTLDCSLLLLGDSRPEIIVESLLSLGYNDSDNKLHVDYVKVSHHGSKNNTSCELLDLIECDNFYISTNGGSSSHKHPNREVIARIVYHPKRNFKNKRHIYFNYSIMKILEKCGKIFEDDDFKDGNWEVHEL